MKFDYRVRPEKIEILQIQEEDVFKTIKKLKPDQIDTWVDENVKTLADVRRILKKLLRAVAFLTRYARI